FFTDFFYLLLSLLLYHVGVVLDLDGFLRFLVLFGVRFGFALHLLHFFLGKTGTAGDGNFLFLPSAQIFGRDVQNTVRVRIESYFDLRHTTRSGWNSVEVEDAKLFIVAGQWALTLYHLDLYALLYVAVSRYDLLFSCLNCSILIDACDIIVV